MTDAGRSLSGVELARVFPFHFVVDERLELRGFGPSLARLLPQLTAGRRIDAELRIVSPGIAFDFDAVRQQDFTVFLLESLDRRFRLKGQMLALADGPTPSLLFLGSPVINDMGALAGMGLTLKDFAPHDSAVDFLILLQTKSNTLADVKGMAERLRAEVAERREAQKELQRANEVLETRVAERTRDLEQANAGLQNEVLERRRAEALAREGQARLRGLVARLEEHNRQMRLLNAMGDMLQGCDTLGQTYAVISESLQKLFSVAGGALALRAAGGELEVVARWGRGGPAIGQPMTREDCWGLKRMRHHEIDSRDDESLCAHARGAAPAPGHTHACIPLSTHGVPLGLLYLHELPPHEVSEALPASASDRQQLLHSAAEQIALAIANLELRENLRQQSIRDSLTGLYNRRHMEAALAREMARADRAGQPCGLILLDVDHFKRFNDAHGHPAGDSLLAALGGFLADKVRGEDVACRYGGEEFVLILSAATPIAALRRADEIRQAVGSALRLHHDGQALPPVTVSLGVACYPDHAADAGGLIAAADEALYQSKRDGRNRATLSRAVPKTSA